jgi:two-component system chemotaxis sensor kinase CheA
MDDFNIALRNTFLEEFSESASRMETLFLILEKKPADSKCIDEIFRLMHNTKGSSRAVGLDSMAKLAHSCESLLSDVRSGKIIPSIAFVSPLLQALDAMKSGTQNIDDAKENSAVFDQAISSLRLLSSPDAGQPAKMKSNSSSPILEENSKDDAFINFSLEADPNGLKESPRAHHSENTSIESTTNELKKTHSSNTLDTNHSKSQPNIEGNNAGSNSSVQPNPNNSAKSEDSIRVSLSKLEEIQNKFGEQVILQSALDHTFAQNPTDLQHSEKMLAQLRKISGNLQGMILSLRMVPISTILVRLNRAVRDVALSTNKLAEIRLEGGDSELDKNILEQLIDPLVHMVRNSVDHGIETPKERQLKNKPPSGTIKIIARGLGKYLEIEISDDGKGLSKEKILEKAYSTGMVPNGLVPESKDIFKLIFSSGFSTKPAANEFSGRGVGMDVVKTNIERVGGTIDLSSVEGSGTTFKLKIPLTLAIVPGLIVKSRNQHFAIPQSDLAELVRIDADEPISEKITILQGTPVLKLREKILPLLNLTDILTKENSKKGILAEDWLKRGPINIVILNADSIQFGLAVDSVEDTADIVVKPLPSFLKQITHFSGASIMGDGSVALLLDVMGISQDVSLAPTAESSVYQNDKGVPASASHHQLETSEFLMIDIGAPGNYMIPVQMVTRLEEFNIEDIELAGEQRVVRYRDSILPILSLPDFLNLPFPKNHLDKEKSQVVVISRGERLYGIEVLQILDVATLPSKINLSIRDRPGILGTMAVEDKILVVADIFGIIDAMTNRLAVDAGVASKDTHLGNKSAKIDLTNKRRQFRILIAEDSSFFRNFMRKILTEAGYQTEIACDGLEALNSLENADDNYFNMVLSDIEMPELNGLELAKQLTSNPKYKKIPLIAITTKYSSSHKEQGLEAGFTRYLEKLNAETLISEIDELLIQKNENHEPIEELKLTSNF